MTTPFDNVEFDEERTTAKLAIDKKVYSKSAVLNACYWFHRDLYFQIVDRGDDLHLFVSARVKNATLSQPKVKQINEWLPEVFNALIDAQLREQIQAETAQIRELIIAKAFAESGVLEDPPPGTFEDPVEEKKSQTKPLVQIGTGSHSK